MQNKSNYIFFDLETNGLDYYTTGIMQITMLDINGNVMLNQYVYPFDKRIDASHIHGITEEKLIDNNAISTIELCELIKKIIREKFNRETVYFIGYNNFGYDQIILENNFKIVNIKMPNNWLFIDIYPIIKELYPVMKPNYKLCTVFENLCGKDNTVNFHCALADTQCLYKVYKKIENNDEIFKKYTRPPLHNIEIMDTLFNTMQGYSKSINFEGKNINTIGDMYNIYKACFFNNDCFELYLRNKLNIYSNFYVNNIKKQLNIIHHLQNNNENLENNNNQYLRSIKKQKF